jgi:hypothetical protein
MITREQAVNLVQEFEKARIEQIQKDATDFVNNVIDSKIETKAKNGGSILENITIPKNIDCGAVCKIITENGFKIIAKSDPRVITITW